MGKVRRDLAYWGVVATVSYILFLHDDEKRSHFHTYPYGDSSSYQTLTVCVLSMLANLGVVAYHSDYPPHPKFTLLPRRRLCLYVHIISGLIEIFGMVCAFFSPWPEPFAYLAVAAAFLGHIPSATYQWPIVFGIKSVMIPSYFMFLVSHFWAASKLAADPDDPMRLAKLCIALHGYVWVRVSIAIFQTMKILKEVEYSVAIFFAGFLMTPMLFGVGSNFYFILAYLSFHFLVDPLLNMVGFHWESNTEEYSRETVLTDNTKRRVVLHTLAHLPEERRSSTMAHFEVMDDNEMARLVFDRLDTNGDGSLQMDELEELVTQLGYSHTKVGNLLKKWDTDGSGDISFGEFYRHIWNLTRRRNQLMAVNRITKVVKRKVDEEEMAEVVFDSLLVDNESDNVDGLSVEPLCQLLASWGLPISEVRVYMKNFDENGDGMIDFREFRQHFGPFYRYAYLILSSELETQFLVRRRRDSSHHLKPQDVEALRNSVDETLRIEAAHHALLKEE